MSYVIQIWDQPARQPLPTTVAEADGIVGELGSQQPGQNAKFVALAQRLTTRYPCICSAEAEELPESEWAWSDGPLTGKTASAVFSLGLATRRLDEVLPFVVVSANALRLNVFDAQAAAVYLADGTVLGTGSARPPAPGTVADPDLPAEKELLDALFDGLEPFLAQYGFKGKKRGASFKRVFPGGWQTLEFVTDWWPDPSRIGYGAYFSGRLDEVNELLEAVLLRPGTEQDRKARGTMGSGLERLIHPVPVSQKPPLLSVSRRQDMPTEIDWLKARFVDSVMPLLDKLQTVAGYDEMLNTQPLTDSMFFNRNTLNGSRCILTAYLANNPRLDAIVTEFDANTLPYPLSKEANETQKCITYVRSRLAGGDA